MQDGCLQVMDVDRTLSGVESQVVRSAHVGTRLRAAAGEPHRERVDVVVATDAGGFWGWATGVRPNSPPQMTSVSSSNPRCLRSWISAATG